MCEVVWDLKKTQKTEQDPDFVCKENSKQATRTEIGDSWSLVRWNSEGRLCFYVGGCIPFCVSLFSSALMHAAAHWDYIIPGTMKSFE